MSLQKDPEGFEKRILHKFLDFKDKRILEVGCGEGRLTWQYAAASSLTVGFDPDHSALRVARADARDKSRDTYFASASASHIPFSKETFDIAILAWSL
ncbi:MAG: class I SAM-dependent methyltransferase [Chloroflexi bacterium]|nr:class I SAM-dependent methyltransferase [Chloroflexota bacterium]